MFLTDIYIYIFIFICIHICIYIYIYRERESILHTMPKLLTSQASLAVNVTFSDELWFRLCGAGTHSMSIESCRVWGLGSLNDII